MRLITDILRGIRRGRVVEAASDQLAAVVRGVLDTERPGELILKIKVTSRGKGDNAVLLQCEIKAKVPQALLPDALFFADLDGDLHVNDPTQVRMFADAAFDPETGEVTDKKAN